MNRYVILESLACCKASLCLIAALAILDGVLPVAALTHAVHLSISRVSGTENGAFSQSFAANSIRCCPEAVVK
jgi:hypothetical protein